MLLKEAAAGASPFSLLAGGWLQMIENRKMKNFSLTVSSSFWNQIGIQVPQK